MNCFGRYRRRTHFITFINALPSPMVMREASVASLSQLVLGVISSKARQDWSSNLLFITFLGSLLVELEK